jgi:hypothetical protein
VSKKRPSHAEEDQVAAFLRLSCDAAQARIVRLEVHLHDTEQALQAAKEELAIHTVEEAAAKSAAEFWAMKFRSVQRELVAARFIAPRLQPKTTPV